MKETPVERQRFYTAIKEVYSKGEKLTAKECAIRLMPTGLVKYPTRQATQPRIVELCKMGWLEAVGSTFDFDTRKTVTVYALQEDKK